MDIAFSVLDWAAHAPGLTTRTHWRHWAQNPDLPAGEVHPPSDAIPVMLRRRLGTLGRLAVQVASDCQPTSNTSTPVVLASRYGDAARALALLDQHAQGQAMSPTDFALSVHNAIGATYSIAHTHRTNYATVCAGEASAAYALVEAVGLLDEGAHDVLLVCYDAPLPAAYADFADAPAATYAWAWRVSTPRAKAPVIGLQCHAQHRRRARPALPFGLEAMRFLLSDERESAVHTAQHIWTWRRNA